MSLLKLENATYYLENREKPILDNLTVSFDRGKIYFVFSRHAMEKSVLVSLIGGLDLFDKGILRYEGKMLHKASIDDYRKKEVGVILRQYDFLPTQSPLENLYQYCKVLQRKITKEDCLKHLRKLGIGDYHANTPMVKLDTITQKKFELAKATARSPSIMIADELFKDIDNLTRKAFLNYLRYLAEEKQMAVIITANNQEPVQYADEIWGLNQGKLTYITGKKLKNDKS